MKGKLLARSCCVRPFLSSLNRTQVQGDGERSKIATEAVGSSERTQIVRFPPLRSSPGVLWISSIVRPMVYRIASTPWPRGVFSVFQGLPGRRGVLGGGGTAENGRSSFWVLGTGLGVLRTVRGTSVCRRYVRAGIG
eukprot:6204112-Pleurochrysis_carterae.AAC.1